MSFIRLSLSRTRVASALILGAAFVLAVGCSDDNNKRALVPGAEGGEGGAAGAPESAAGASGRVSGEAGTIEPGAAGAAGMSEAPEGEGGTAGSGEPGLGSAGSAGATDSASAGAGGEAGASALECVPAGSVTAPQFAGEGSFTVCRGSGQFVTFYASDSDDTFTCCGVSDTETPYAIELSGFKSSDPEASGGKFAFSIPDDAPFGLQTISATCSSGLVKYGMQINVSDSDAPVVSSATASLATDGIMVIQGSHLSDVTQIFAQDAEGASHVCTKDAETSDDSQISCSFGDEVIPGKYYLFVETVGCGLALNVPRFTLVAPPTISANKLH